MKSEKILPLSECEALAARAFEVGRLKSRLMKPMSIAAVVEGYDCPLVYVSDAFLWMTGFSREECLGRNCRFLQGKHTSPESVAQIRGAVRAFQPVSVKLINYRKDGAPFVNGFRLDTIDSPEDGLKFFIGTQTDISIGSIYDRVDEWNTAQVCDFLEQRGFDHDPFLQAQVDGLQLMKLSKDELVRLGVANRDYDRFDMFLKLEISYRRALDETLKEDKLKSQ